jgi:hypothetical protein
MNACNDRRRQLSAALRYPVRFNEDAEQQMVNT